MPAVSNFISGAWRRYRKQSGFSQELTALVLAAVFGLVALPLLIWLGGHLVLGEYIRNPMTGQTGGPLALWMDYLEALAEGSPGYWVAAGGLYGTYLILKILRRLLRL
jgi:hypothetical protein